MEGEVLAVVHLEKMPEDQATPILSGLTNEEKLLFVNAFFRRPRFNRPKTEAYGLSVLAEAVEASPDELLILLDLLANRHEYPALPLRNALVRGRLGMWLRRLLQMDLSAEQTRYMARVAGRLRDPELAEKLATRLGDLDELSAETVCRALAETPGLNPEEVVPPLEALAATTPEPSLAAAALCALAKCDPARAATAAAGLLLAHPEHLPLLAPVLAGFSLSGFGSCLRALPPVARKTALGAVYVFLAAALPQSLQAAARAVCATGAHPPALQQALLTDLHGRAGSPPAPFRRRRNRLRPQPPRAKTKACGNGSRAWSSSQENPGDDAATQALRRNWPRAASGVTARSCGNPWTGWPWRAFP